MSPNILIGWIIAALCGGLGGAVFTWWANRNFRKPPELSLRLARDEGEPNQIAYSDGSFEDARYYHMRVSNARRRWSTATDVRVFLTRMDEQGPDGTFQLAWVGDIPLSWRNQQTSPLTQTVGADTDCDLFFLGDRRRLRIETLFTPNSMRAERNDSCRVALFLQARSTQVDSPMYRVEISWDGTWEPGETEIQRHLRIAIQELQSP
jgi:hypothetical protein